MSYNYKVSARLNIQNGKDRSEMVSILATAGYTVRITEEKDTIFHDRVNKYWVEILAIDTK